MWDDIDKVEYERLRKQQLGQICNDSFSKYITEFALNKKYKNYLEIGTWNGLGSTKAFIDGLLKRNDNYCFYSLECNKDKSVDAKNRYNKYHKVHILNEVIWNEEPSDFYEIFPQCLTNKMYKRWNEVDLINMKKCKLFLNRTNLPKIFDVILLDGGEFTTYHEFQKLKNRCKILMLDDINTDKCKLIVKEIENNPNWIILKKENVRNGFLIAENKNIWLENYNQITLKIWQNMVKPDIKEFLLQPNVYDEISHTLEHSIGFAYHFIGFDRKLQEKIIYGKHKNLVFSSMSLQTDNRRRGHLKINRKNINDILNKNNIKNQLVTPVEYYRKLSNYKFTISPEGNGIDCHRHYEAIICGCIPIIEDNIYMKKKYSGLPVLFTKDYSEINEEYLNKVYDKMIKTKYNFSKMFISYYSQETQKEIKKLGNIVCKRELNKNAYDN